MFKKTAIVASAAAGLMMIGAPAFATEPGEIEANDNTNQIGLINVDDVLSNNDINLCDTLDLNLIAILGGNSTGDTVCTNAEANND
ncbi:hypothetical protein ACWGRK_06145 [Saccharomonospora azurea]|uniref:hypothetical protein n=1 Tax=Saccharomonospora azurea TaxID=40988 RepID=UPI00023FF0B5|nr:hypothetical protein [Saccharomonospora azurea]EHK80128.1 hypothetical protein SZMC14600_23275 [Saccharomonospora azurea SZMC 14600]EHK86606.1 hypothetical protein SZMC14600_14540 [Saccharomonospora azurea SZMC 14600]